MRLFGAMEYLIVTVGNDGTLHGMRLQRRHKRLTVIRALEVPPDERSAADRLADLCRKLDRRRDMTLVIGAGVSGGGFLPEPDAGDVAAGIGVGVAVRGAAAGVEAPAGVGVAVHRRPRR